MKNRTNVLSVRLFGFAALALAIVISMAVSLAGCSNPADGEDPDLPGTITISPTSNVIIGTELTATYSGTETITYQWNMGGPVSGAVQRTFTPTAAGSYTVTVSAAGYKSKTSAPVIVTDSVSTGEGGGKYDTILLWAVRWVDGEGSGEQWASENQIKLSDFTTVKPQQGDVLSFKISGVSDTELKYFLIELFQLQGNDWSTYKWLGNSSLPVTLDYPSFNNHIIEVPIQVEPDPDPNAVFYVVLMNRMYQKWNDEYIFNSGETIPAGIPNDTIMATISNFSISLDSITRPGKLTITNFSGSPGLKQNFWVEGYVYMGDKKDKKSVVVDDDEENYGEYELAAGEREHTELTFGSGMWVGMWWVEPVQIKGDTITMKGWVHSYTEYYYYTIDEDYEGYVSEIHENHITPFTGNITVPAGDLLIIQYSDDDYAVYTNKVPITFTNGNATINFGTQMVPDGGDPDAPPSRPKEEKGLE